MEDYLKENDIINFSHPDIQSLAKELSKGCQDDTHIAKNCFLYVRDEIRHTGDSKDMISTTCKASEVLKHRTGWCYAKSHLLAALLRANHIPSGFCYQRLSCSEYKEGIFCLHGLNWIYLQEHGWYRVDARGNKEGVDAQFNPPHEQLAFKIGKEEYDLKENLSQPLIEIINALNNNKNYKEMVANFPDIN